MNHDDIVVLAGIKFLVEVVSPTYKKLVPVDDPDWLIRVINETLMTRKV